MPKNDNDIASSPDQSATPSGSDARREASPWHLLIVDQEEQTHQVMRFALGGLHLFGRPLQLHSTYSAAEARDALAHQRFACVLTAVHLESDQAGLDLVSHIRRDPANATTRIILCVTSPEEAPDAELIHQQDISDYQFKAELTPKRLTTSVSSALRTVQPLEAVATQHRGLEIIVTSTSLATPADTVTRVIEGVLVQIQGLLQTNMAGILLAQASTENDEELRIVAGAGLYEPVDLAKINADELDPQLRRALTQVLRDRTSILTPTQSLLYVPAPRGEATAVCIATFQPLDPNQQRLLETFAQNVSVHLDNAHLFGELQAFAFRDNLTSLPNRAAFEKELAWQIRQHSALTLVVADIDNFQAVNDGLGHDIGNKTLQTCANILQKIFGKNTFIARTSSDSFTMILPDLEPAKLDKLLKSFSTHFARNLEIEEHEIPLTMSLGIARYPDHGNTATLLFQNAGIALKQAKRANRSSYQFFDNQLERNLQSHLQTIRELRYSVERNSLRLFYQPQINLGTQQVFGVEALVRWQRTEQQLVAPNAFIPAAEDSGQIVAMGEWILREACLQQQRWAHQHGLDIQMAVNVSMRQLKDPNFLGMVQQVLRQTSVNPTKIELEVTESMMMEDTNGLSQVLRQLRTLGVRVAIDDFGTGYSSLSYLQKLPIDRLKIDRSFINALTQQHEDQVIAALIINMGHLLNLRVIAEGVETAEQEARLRAMGCDDVQGFYYAKPLPADEVLALAQARLGTAKKR